MIPSLKGSFTDHLPSGDVTDLRRALTERLNALISGGCPASTSADTVERPKPDSQSFGFSSFSRHDVNLAGQIASVATRKAALANDPLDGLGDAISFIEEMASVYEAGYIKYAAMHFFVHNDNAKKYLTLYPLEHRMTGLAHG